jgi:uncharacterized protein (TIGR03437 family)
MRTLGSLIVFGSFAFAQLAAAQPAIVGADYTATFPLPVAPGQLITLIVDGLASPLPGPARAPAGSLPNTLAGISAIFRQVTNLSAPVLEVLPFSTCSIPLPSPCGSLVAVTIQIPFEIQTFCAECAQPGVPAYLAIAQNGTIGELVSVTPLPNKVHLLTSCDTLVSGLMPQPLTGGLPCAPLVMHGAGKKVSAANPAHSGEELVAYAVGLGQTVEPQTTGQALNISAPTSTLYGVDFNYRPNALATKPTGPGTNQIPPPTPNAIYPMPLFTGTTPGFVGLYQINFTVPQAPVGLPPCVDYTTAGPFANVVQSNLTVSVGSAYSFDGAGICVQPGS